MSAKSQEKKKEATAISKESESVPQVDAFSKGKNKHKQPHDDRNPVINAEPLKRKTLDDQLDVPADNWHSLANHSESVVPETKADSHVKLVLKKREMPELPKEEETITTILTESELPPEVDAFVKGKNKYRHPYGDWKPVVKVEPLKRDTFADQLDLPTDNWYLPENQPIAIIPEIKDDSHVKLVFKEREITGLPSSSSSKTSDPVVFKKRKMTSNRQLRGSDNKEHQKKDDVEES